jgi:hypothetical protein
MYKKDLHRIEDSIVSFILEGLLLSQIKQAPEFEEICEKHLNVLRKAYHVDLNTPKLLKRAERIEKKLLKYWNKNGYVIRKSIMQLSYLVAQLKKEDALILDCNVEKLFKEINKEIKKLYKNGGILKQDKSAIKHVPKALKILQNEGLF